ncbi:hypothetical protein B0H11DRAFT_2224783 [Mycena galericulata]|nr:hypothetical protein B0H11DRAFT_2224783 [Mycena galericulata]
MALPRSTALVTLSASLLRTIVPTIVLRCGSRSFLLSSITRSPLALLQVGLPTVPVFTGVTGAVNGMPSRPVEPFGNTIEGDGYGWPLTAVDGLFA